MPVVSTYWNMVHGNMPEEVRQDAEEGRPCGFGPNLLDGPSMERPLDLAPQAEKASPDQLHPLAKSPGGISGACI